MKKYFTTTNYHIASNYGAKSNSISRAVILAYYPELETRIQSASYPDGSGPETIKTQGMCPGVSIYDDNYITNDLSKQVVLVVSNPVDRFLVAMSASQSTEVDTALTKLENDEMVVLSSGAERKIREISFFTKQSELLYETTKCYKLDEHITNFASDCGLSYPLPTVEDAIDNEITLTQEQEDRILAYYSDDQQLYDSITSAGIEIATEEEQENIAKKLSELQLSMLSQLDTNLKVSQEHGVSVDCSDITEIGQSIRMRTTDDARSNYNEIKNLIDLAGSALPTVSMWDADGGEHALSTTDALTVLSRYAVLAAQQRMAYYTSQTQIYSATTIEELNAIE